MKTVSTDENRFRELAALLPETVYEMDVSGRFTYVNPAGLAQFGYSERDYAAGASPFDMIVPEDHPRARENIALAIAGKPVCQSEYI
jgi:PAS domain S-box-containing protein